MITKLIAKYYDLLREENSICSRKDYWIFILISFIINTLMLFGCAILNEFELPNIILLPFFLIFITLLVIGTVLAIKRMHDINLSGFWILLPGVALILLLLPAVTYKNKYISKEDFLTEEDKEDKEENEKLEAFISLLENQNTKEK